jgi:hypothetical protein
MCALRVTQRQFKLVTASHLTGDLEPEKYRRRPGASRYSSLLQRRLPKSAGHAIPNESQGIDEVSFSGSVRSNQEIQRPQLHVAMRDAFEVSNFDAFQKG